MFAAGLSQVTHVFIFLAFLQKEVNVYLSSRCLLSTRQSLTLTTTPLALTLPLIFWLLSADSRDTSSASTANSDDVYANCQLFSQLLLLKLIGIGLGSLKIGWTPATGAFEIVYLYFAITLLLLKMYCWLTGKSRYNALLAHECLRDIDNR